jgi:hypothetical protein
MKRNNLSIEIQARIESARELLANTDTIPVELFGEEYLVEYLIIPAMTKEGALKPSIFIYPGGGTHLAPCFEAQMHLDQEIIVISPLGYGKSSDVPGWIFQNFPLHGANAALQVLSELGKINVEIHTHSNAAPIGLRMALYSREYGITVTGITMINPMGFRWISQLWAALAFPLSGMLTRLLSLGCEYPYRYLKDAYKLPKRKFSLSSMRNSFWKMCYELDKSSESRLPKMFREMQGKNLRIPIIVIQSSWDWASFHFPWTKSNREILMENIPNNLLKIIPISGLHNVTLGKDSGVLSKVMKESIWITPLALISLPQIPVFVEWLMRGLGLA